MPNRARAPLTVALAAALLAACSPVAGETVATDAMRVDLQLLAFPAPRTSTLTVGFDTGSPTRRVDLETGALVEASHLGGVFPLARDFGPGPFDGVAYVGEVPDVAPDDVVGFRLRRPVEVDSSVSEVVVPPAPTGVALPGGPDYAYGDVVEVTWTPTLGDDVWARLQPFVCPGASDDEVAFLRLILGTPVVAADADAALELELGTVTDPGYPDCTFEVQIGYVREAIDLAPEFASADEIEVVSLTAPFPIQVVGAP